MDFIKQLFNFLISEGGLNKITELISAFSNGELNLTTLLNSVTPETLGQVFNSFSNNKSREDNFSAYGIEPIKDIACPNVLQALNEYIG